MIMSFAVLRVHDVQEEYIGVIQVHMSFFLTSVISVGSLKRRRCFIPSNYCLIPDGKESF